MLREYSCTKAESLAQIRASIIELQHFFLRNCFLLAHPVYTTLWHSFAREVIEVRPNCYITLLIRMSIRLSIFS